VRPTGNGKYGLSITATKFAGSSTGAYVVPHAEVLEGALDAQGAHTRAIVPAIVIEAIVASSFRRMGDLLLSRFPSDPLLARSEPALNACPRKEVDPRVWPRGSLGSDHPV